MGMLETLQQEEAMDKAAMIDRQADHPSDWEQNPLGDNPVAKAGKHKGKLMSVIYQTEKDYVKWVRNHVDEKFSREMRALRIVVEFVDAKKRTRLEEQGAIQGSQVPMSSQATGSMTQGLVLTSPRVAGMVRAREREEWEMEEDWQEIQNFPSIPDMRPAQFPPPRTAVKWQSMAEQAVEMDQRKKQKVIARLAQHPKGFAAMTNILEK